MKFWDEETGEVTYVNSFDSGGTTVLSYLNTEGYPDNNRTLVLSNVQILFGSEEIRITGFKRLREGKYELKTFDLLKHKPRKLK